jgi:hypothetical protein
MKNRVALLLLMAAGSAAAAETEYVLCMNSVGADERLIPLADKVALLQTKTQTFQMLANTTYPSKEEQSLIGIWANARQECFNQAESERVRTTAPPVLPVIAESNVKFNAVTADLYNGKLTYGQFAQIRAQHFAEYQAQANAAFEQFKRQRQADARYEDSQENARRQAVLGVLANQRPYVPAQIQPYQMPVPQTTNCTTFGNQINCTQR